MLDMHSPLPFFQSFPTKALILSMFVSIGESLSVVVKCCPINLPPAYVVCQRSYAYK